MKEEAHTENRNVTIDKHQQFLRGAINFERATETQVRTDRQSNL